VLDNCHGRGNKYVKMFEEPLRMRLFGNTKTLYEGSIKIVYENNLLSVD